MKDDFLIHCGQVVVLMPSCRGLYKYAMQAEGAECTSKASNNAEDEVKVRQSPKIQKTKIAVTKIQLSLLITKHII